MDECPLCMAKNAKLFCEDQWRKYFRCGRCQLVFVPAKYHLDRNAEKSEYDLHQNSPQDPGYRRFLARIFDAVQDRISPQSQGLDFGCGPGPTLSVMFEEHGHQVALYDPFYAADPSVLNQQYDFVAASEVVEHLRQPNRDLNLIWSCVKPGGLLGIMTKLVLDREAFARWHYKNDRTHVCFFSRATFDWIGGEWNASVTFVGADVICLEKPTTVGSS